MDIPETGAVFTLGKSYLSENHQSYFYIKNDPIKKVISGDNQSAVICESGRLFVWGENQYGQLSAGSKEVITKPSCVKEIKNLGYKVRNIAFGEAFSVILTENNKIFFNGRSIFGANETYGNRIRSSDIGGHCIIKHIYEIVDFQKFCLDDQGNVDDLVDIVAGKQHFAVLTNSGKLYCLGILHENSKAQQQQKCQPHYYTEPKRISEHFVTRIAKCGSTFVVFVTDCNAVFTIGKLNGVDYATATKLNKSAIKNTIYSCYVSRKNDIFLISSAGDVYKSTNDRDIQFEQIILFNQNDNIRKFCSGHDFVCVLTDKHKFLTTFNEKVSATVRQYNKPASTIIPPHELRKFQDLQILDIATGLHHILLFAVSKSSASTSLDLTSSDANENLSIRKYSSSDTSSNHNDAEKRLKCLPAVQIAGSEANANKNIAAEEIKRTVLSTAVLNGIQSDVENIQQIDATIAAVEPEIIERSEQFNESDAPNLSEEDPKDETIATEASPIAKNEHSQSESENLNTMDKLTASITEIGDSIVTDVESIAHAGEVKLNDLAKETQKIATEVPENVIGFVKSTIASKFDDVLGKNDADAVSAKDEDESTMANDVQENMKANTGAEQLPPVQLPESKLLNEHKPLPPIRLPSIDLDTDQAKPANIAKYDMANDDDGTANEIKVIDNTNEVKFIDNGIDVSNTTNIIQAMKDEINEMTNEVKSKSDELTIKYDGIVKDELDSMTNSVSTKMFEMKNAGNDVMKGATAASAALMTKIIPLKYDVEDVDLENDGDTEQTTASIKSVSTPAKNPMEIEGMANEVDTMVRTNHDGPVKRFFNEIKNNCRTADTVVEPAETQHMKNDIVGDNKASKICTIL